MTAGKKSFKAKLEDGPKGATIIRLPFDPDEVWGGKPRHLLSGTVDGCRLRAAVTSADPAIKLGPAWRRGVSIETGVSVAVTVWPEGPQQGDLAPDILVALSAEPKAAAFYDGLAQFYRKGYLAWIDATKKKPEERARRIKETVKLLKAGVKERPK
jgi:Bacteriocin-protection, YdeI or OmpD-Associated/Domain of unknown function (DUF1905)